MFSADVDTGHLFAYVHARSTFLDEQNTTVLTY